MPLVDLQSSLHEDTDVGIADTGLVFTGMRTQGIQGWFPVVDLAS